MKILKINKKNFRKVIKIAEQSIKRGEVIVCPTDTVYGLIADAKNKKAIKKIFKTKKRKITKPLPIFVKDLEMAKKSAFIDKKQEKFLKKVWPGKVTMILRPRPQKFPEGIGKKNKEIGLRIPNYKLLNEILKKFGKPLVQTSANISERKTPENINEILKTFKGKYKPDLILNGGILKGKASIILDLTQNPPKILRF